MNALKLIKMQICYLQKKEMSKVTRPKGSVLLNLLGGFFIILFLLPNLSQAQDKVQGGEFIIEPPTLQNLLFVHVPAKIKVSVQLLALP